MKTLAVASQLALASLVVLCLSAFSGCGSGPAGSGGGQASLGEQSPELTDGVLVMQVFPGSPAEKAGLKSGDIIIGYNGVSTPDNVIYDQAKEEADQKKLESVDLTVLRGSKLQIVKAPGGTLGFEKRSWVGVLEAVFLRLEQGKPEQASQIIDVAEAESALKPEQLLVARIWTVPDVATPEQETRRNEWLAKLYELVPADGLTELAKQQFVSYRRHGAAAACFAHVLEGSPGDTVARLNLAVSYTALGKFNEAASEIATVEKAGKSTLTDTGIKTVERTKANIAIGKRDYKTALAFYSAAVSSDAGQQDSVTQSLYLYSAARSGDPAAFAIAIDRVRTLQGESPDLMDVHMKLLETFALSLQKKDAEATAKANELSEDLPAIVVSFWQSVPDGQEVLDRWKAARQASK